MRLAAGEPHWEGGNNLMHHLWWHQAMFHVERGEFDAVLALYDRRFRDHASPVTQAMPDLYIDVQNAASMLWRLQQQSRNISGSTDAARQEQARLSAEAQALGAEIAAMEGRRRALGADIARGEQILAEQRRALDALQGSGASGPMPGGGPGGAPPLR
jgi:hypothetical protein